MHSNVYLTTIPQLKRSTYYTMPNETHANHQYSPI